jgi:general secretion pathway protein D
VALVQVNRFRTSWSVCLVSVKLRGRSLGSNAALAAMIAVSCMLPGCTAPFEQLSLPGPVVPPSGTEPSRPNETAKGLALSPRGDPSAGQKHVYPGSGNFTSTGGITETGSKVSSEARQAQPSSQPTSTTTADGVTINLVGASIAEVAKTVLGDILGVNYSVSDKLKGAITLRTTHPVSKAGLQETFEAVLRNEGAVLVVRGDLYQVLPAAEAAANGSPLRSGRRSDSNTAGQSTEIVPLRFVTAAEMERVLHSAAPQAGVLRVDAARNLVLLTGTPSELSALKELIDTFDVDWMRGMSFGLFPVGAAEPETIAKELDTIFANDRDGPTKGMTRFIGNRRLKSVLVIAARPEYLRKAEAWIARIDKVNQATQKQVNVYHVQHRPVSEMARLLQRVYSGQSTGSGSAAAALSTGGGLALDQSRPMTGGGGSTGGGGGAGSSLGNGGGGSGLPAAGAAPPASSSGATGQPASAPSAIGEGGLAADAGSSDGHSGGSSAPTDDRTAGISIVADEPNNSLVITATSSEYRRVLHILETLDTHPNDVLLEATIAEVTLNDQLQFGVRWFFQNNSQNQSIGFTDLSGLVGGPVGGLSYLIKRVNIQVLVNALKNVTDVNVLSQPSLMMVENKKATLQIGDEVPVLTQTQQSAAITGTPTISNAVSYRNTGILLSITPRVASDGTVLLEIEQEVSDTKSNTTSGIDSPAFSQRRVKTTVSTKDGETIVLAGMIQDKSTRSRDQVPLLGDVPLIGNVFKNKTDTIVRTELLIAITPQVIRDSQQIDAVTTELRDNLNFSTRPQRRTPPDRFEDLSRIIR